MARQRQLQPNGDHRQWSHSPAAEKPLKHFFKIIIPQNINEKKLKIPIRFVREFGHELSDAANFIFPNGCAWKVGLTKVQNDIWFDDGWHDFIEHHSICNGYLLVFGYRGFSNFNIFIFDASGCEIEYSCNDQGPTCGKKCIIQNEVEEGDDRSIDIRILSPSSSCLKSNICDAIAIKEEPSKRLLPTEQKPGMKKRSRGAASATSPNFRPHYETRNKRRKMEQLAELSDVNANEHIMSCSHEVNELQDVDRSKITSGENQLEPECEDIEIITPETLMFSKLSSESNRVNHAARKYKPKHPSFMVVLRAYNFRCSGVYVPAGFSGRYLSGTSTPKCIKVQVSDGREWTIGIRKISECLMLGKGFTAFCRENSLKAGDFCVFELVENNPVTVMKASIFHAV